MKTKAIAQHYHQTYLLLPTYQLITHIELIPIPSQQEVWERSESCCASQALSEVHVQTIEKQCKRSSSLLWAKQGPLEAIAREGWRILNITISSITGYFFHMQTRKKHHFLGDLRCRRVLEAITVKMQECTFN